MEHIDNRPKNMAYQTKEQFKVIQQANVIAQEKQDKYRCLGRNKRNSEKHNNSHTRGGKVFGGIPMGKAELRKRIRVRLEKSKTSPTVLSKLNLDNYYKAKK